MPYILQTPEDVFRAIKNGKIERVDLRFTDLPGQWQRLSVPPSSIDLGIFEHGARLGQASTRGFQKIEETDLRAIPEPASAFVDPFAEMPTLTMICNIRDSISGQRYARDPRYVAQKAEAFLQTTQIGQLAPYGQGVLAGPNQKPERRSSSSHGAKLRGNKAYFPVPPMEVQQDVRAQVIAALDKLGIELAARDDDIAPGGRGKIDMRFTRLTRMADSVMIFKYVVENVARRNGVTAAFMPQPPFSDGGPAMCIYQSIWQGEQPLFAGDGYAGTSALMRHYIAGLVEHAPALLAICAPTVHSYLRPMLDLKTPVNLGHAQRRAAVSRVTYSLDKKAKLVELRCPDLSCNPYLAFAAMLMAGIDGFHNRLYNIDPEEPIEKFYHQQPQKQREKGPSALGGLGEALDPLAADRDFLLRGNVFTPDVIETHLRYNQAS
jgi:glutamine synthetase